MSGNASRQYSYAQFGMASLPSVMNGFRQFHLRHAIKSSGREQAETPDNPCEAAMLHRGEPDEGGYWATCLEVPGANGQDETSEECLKNLAKGVNLILELNEEEALRDDPHAVKASLALA